MGEGGFGVSDFWALPWPIRGPAQEKYMSIRARNMSAGKNTAPETTFPPPDGLERRFFGLAHLPQLLFRHFWSNFCQNVGKPVKTMKTHENPVFHGFPTFQCFPSTFTILPCSAAEKNTLYICSEHPSADECDPEFRLRRLGALRSAVGPFSKLMCTYDIPS